MNRALLLFGSNIEPRLTFLVKAERKVEVSIGKIIQLSLVYESKPWGFDAEQNFLNRIAIIETDLSPQEVLKCVLSIENEFGRRRCEDGYSSRQIDIDILYFNNMILEEPGLSIPHPGIADRRFVLVPLAEIAGELLHPVLKKTNDELLEQCTDPSKIWHFELQKEA